MNPIKTTIALTMATVLVSAMAQAATITATQSGNLLDTNTWGGVALPIAGNTDTWLFPGTGSITNLTLAANVVPFDGGTLELAGGLFTANNTSDNTARVLTMNNLVLSGGTLQSGPYTTTRKTWNIDLTGDTLTLNSGTLKSNANNNNGQLLFRNGILAGNGTIQVTAGITPIATGGVLFQNTINMTGFTGTFDVNNNGLLLLPNIASSNASFKIAVSGTGKLKNDAANISVTGLTLGGSPIASGTYTAADLPAFSSYFFAPANTNFTITVVGGGSPAAAAPNFVSITSLPAGTVSMTATGEVGTAYSLWAATFLTAGAITNTGTVIASGTITESPFQLDDGGATNHTTRFYQLTTP